MMVLRGYRRDTKRLVFEFPIPVGCEGETLRRAFVPEWHTIVKYPVPPHAARSIVAYLGAVLEQKAPIIYFLEESSYAV